MYSERLPYILNRYSQQIGMDPHMEKVSEERVHETLKRSIDLKRSKDFTHRITELGDLTGIVHRLQNVPDNYAPFLVLCAILRGHKLPTPMV